MHSRLVSFAVFAVASILGGAPTACGEVLASFRPPTATDPSLQVSVSAYRAYVKAQADSLVGMTRVLAKEVEDGNLDAAQSAYAPAHRFLKRIEPIAFLLQDLHKSIDARADAYGDKEADPRFTGFHRLEYGLFAKRFTTDMAVHAHQLDKDVREFRARIVDAPLTPSTMLDAVVASTNDVAVKKLGGDEEAYSRTDLWDLEANIDGVEQIVTLLQPSLEVQHAEVFARARRHFAQFSDMLAKQKDGCGFKNYDEVSRDDKAALKASVVALAGDLSTLRGALTVD